MSLETVFPDLCLRMRQLRDALGGLRLTVAEDKPLRDDVALVDHRTDTIDDVTGQVEEALVAAERGRRAAGPPAKLDAARKALIQCQAAYNLATHRFNADLVSYDRMAELSGLGRQRGGEWQAWVVGVKEALRRYEQPAYDVNQALFACWRELSERATTPRVNVRTTSIGQKIYVPAPETAGRAD